MRQYTEDAIAGDQRPKVYELLADAFVAEGVSVIFAIVGYGNRHFLAAAADRGIRVVTARHEGAALAMADGYARAGGGVGVISVHYGPGVTQLPTSLMVANKHGTPVVVFAAGLPLDVRHRGGPLDLDERALLEASGALVVELVRSSDALETAHRAFRTARRQSTPVALLAPVDLQEQEAVSAGAAVGTPHGVENDGGRPTTVPAEEDLGRAVALLRGAERPLVLAGRGGLSARARDLAIGIADQLGAVVTTSFGGKGLFDGHPRSLGTAGGFSLPADRRLIEQADCVLAVGASLNARTTDNGKLFAAAELIQVDDDASAFDRAQPAAQLQLLGDATATLSRLAELLKGSEPVTGWKPMLPVVDARESAIASVPVTVESGTVDPRRFMLEMDKRLTDDAAVVVGGGHFMGFALQYLRNPAARSFDLVFDFMTTGQALPSAVGAAMACPDRMVVAVEGDASVLMHIQELETAARTGTPLLVLVLNDGALGAEYHGLVGDGMSGEVALAGTPALADVAVALGGRGMTVTSIDQVDEVIGWYDPARGPHLVDVRISRDVLGP